MKRWHVILAVLLCVVAMVLFGVYTLVKVGLRELREQMTEEIIPADKRQAYEDWRSQPLTFPEEAVTVEPFAVETEQAAERFNEQWADQQTSATELARQYWELTSDLKPAALTTDPGKVRLLARRVERHAAMLDNFAQTLARPDFAWDAIAPPEPGMEMGTFSGFGLTLGSLPGRVTIRLLQLRGHGAALEGRADAVLRDTATLTRAARIGRWTPVQHRGLALDAIESATRVWHAAAAHSEDVEFLRELIAAQNDMAGHAPFLADGPQVDASDSVGRLRLYARRGVDVTIQDKTAPELYGDTLVAAADWLQQRAAPDMTEDDRRKLEDEINSIRLLAASFGARGGPPGSFAMRWVSGLSLPMVFVSAEQTLAQGALSERLVRTRLDLTRLATARKLFMLEHGREPTADDLTAELPDAAALTDRFASGGARYAIGESMRSVGPDGIDDEGLVAYRAADGPGGLGDMIVRLDDPESLGAPSLIVPHAAMFDEDYEPGMDGEGFEFEIETPAGTPPREADEPAPAG